MKKTGNKISVIVAFVLSFLLLLGSTPMTAQAQGKIDTSRTGKLTVIYSYGEDLYFSGVKSSIYKIGSATEDGSFTLDARYVEVSSIKDLDTITDPDTADSQWKQILEDVKETALSGDATYTAVSEDGKAVFSNLKLGIYLVNSDKVEEDDCTYVFAPFLVTVPQLGEDNEWIYEGASYLATAVAKCEKFDKEKEVEFSLLKRWQDRGAERRRPASITVEIKKDGEFYELVTLSSSNNWQYSWKDEPGHEWSFDETVKGSVKYKMKIKNTVTADGGKVVYTMTNSYTPPDTPPDTPGNPPDTPPDTPPGPPRIPDIPEVLGAVRELPAVLGARRLPQTGQLWWPIPVLVIGGIFLIVKGVRKASKSTAK